MVWPVQGLPVNGGVIGPGATGGNGDVETLSVFGGLTPQSFEALTLIKPLLDPAVTVMLFVPCPAVMIQPEGTIQV